MLHLLAQATETALTTPAAHTNAFAPNALLSFLYGIVEGLTEFLPVSSTAHLRIVEAFTGTDLDSGYWKMYSIVIQLGAILSVPLLFKNRILKFLHTFPKGENGNKTIFNHPLSLVIIGFLVTAGPCYLADKKIGKNLENLTVMAIALVVGGIIMWVVDFLCRNPKVNRMEDMGILDAVWIGAVQILSAVFPGTSRSMSTIAAGQVFSLSRATALEYSFFLSIPTMFAATGYKLLQAIVHHKTPEEAAAYNPPEHQWIILAIGFVVSFIVAFGVNAWFINWVRTRGFAPFAVYRILLCGAILIWLFTGGH
jgi:undecaprenyl-diphosphatase